MDIPIQALPSPEYPDGHAGHVPPTEGALLSIQSALLKHEISLQPSASFSQNFPSKAMFNKKY